MRATTFTPRSWPSRPTFATNTRPPDSVAPSIAAHATGAVGCAAAHTGARHRLAASPHGQALDRRSGRHPHGARPDVRDGGGGDPRRADAHLEARACVAAGAPGAVARARRPRVPR